jgi:hypothetical protein
MANLALALGGSLEQYRKLHFEAELGALIRVSLAKLERNPFSRMQNHLWLIMENAGRENQRHMYTNSPFGVFARQLHFALWQTKIPASLDRTASVHSGRQDGEIRFQCRCRLCLVEGIGDAARAARHTKG